MQLPPVDLRSEAAPSRGATHGRRLAREPKTKGSRAATEKPAIGAGSSVGLFVVRSTFLIAVGALVLGPIIFSCAGQDGAASSPHAPTTTGVLGAPAPDFTGLDIDGKSVTLSSHLGKNVVLLDFCSTWCEPCVAEFPHLRTLYEANKAKGFIILAISVDGPETVANVPAFARRNQLTFPMLTDETSRIAPLYNPKKTAPLTVLIDRSGKIVLVHEGYTAGDELALAHEVATALSGAPAQ